MLYSKILIQIRLMIGLPMLSRALQRKFLWHGFDLSRLHKYKLHKNEDSLAERKLNDFKKTFYPIMYTLY